MMQTGLFGKENNSVIRMVWFGADTTKSSELSRLPAFYTADVYSLTRAVYYIHEKFH
jgi:hypothetical protein